MQKIAIWARSQNVVGLYLCNYGIYRQSEKNLLNSNISSTRPHNMMKFGPLMAQLVSLGHPSKFQWVSHLGFVKPRLHDTTCCQTGLTTGYVCIHDTTGLTTGCIVYTAGYQTGCTTRFETTG